MLYFVFGYRRKIVRDNIERAFVDESMVFHRSVEKRFYRHFCDLILEGVKNFSIREEEVRRRFIIHNPELVDNFILQGKNVIITGGHYNNWELYALAMPLFHRCDGIALYKPIHNKLLNRKVQKSRSKFGLKLIPQKEIKAYFDRDPAKRKYGFVFGADQSPRKSSKAFWLKFLERDTAVLFGAEKYAVTYDAPVVFGEITKEKRGYYSLKYHLVADKPLETTYGDITKGHTSILEKMIKKRPEFWLWSHKRWKHQKSKFSN